MVVQLLGDPGEGLTDAGLRRRHGVDEDLSALLLQPGVVGEEKGAVADERPADRYAELIKRLGIRK